MEDYDPKDNLLAEKLEVRPIAVDRREETVITRQPGYVATEQMVHDIAAERRMRLFEIYRILWSVLVFMEILLAFRFMLRLIGANPDSGFAVLVYGLSGLFIGGFEGLIATPVYGGSELELTTLIAMLVYVLIFWGIAYVIKIAVDRPRSRSITIMTHEQIPGRQGSIRTTHTTISDGKL
jgi:hypothetical protein